MDTNAKQLGDYLAMLDRRKYLIVFIWVLLTLIAVIVALSLPKTYRSTATMLMQAPTPTKLSDSPIHLYADEQIQTIYQKVLTTANAMAMIKKHALFVSQDKTENLGDAPDVDLVKAFKESTLVELATSSFTETSAKMADIVFNISFDYEEPAKAQAVVNDLSKLLIELNDRGRTQRATKIADFLMVELEKLNDKTQELNNKIASYKEQNILSLPEQMQSNMASAERMESELRDLDGQIRNTKDKIVYLEAELARAQTDFIPMPGDDNKPKTKEETLRTLQSKYAQLSSIYSPSHPDVMRLKREIKAFSVSAELTPLREEVLKQLAENKSELRLLEETYKDNHPEIIKRRLTVEQLERQLRTARTSAEVQPEVAAPIANPAYAGLKVQYKTYQSELETLYQKQDYLKTKLEQTKNLLTLSPKVEVEYSDMVRERDSTVKKYNELKEKWLDAQLVQTMEEGQQGQTLTVLEPPNLPVHPEKAIRKKVAIGGSLVGLMLGLGLAFVLEYLDPAIRGYYSVIETTGLTPLIVIPYIESFTEQIDKLDHKKEKLKVKFWIILFNIVMVSVFLFFMIQY